MKSPHLLRASANVRRLKENLVDVVDAAAVDAIELAICTNVSQLYALGRHHYSFASHLLNRFWRQKVSRFYYGAYNVSRAVRLCVNGEYSTDPTDHRKIDALPDDFPNKNTYANRLAVLRDDRNLCDYDHTATRRELVLGVADASALVADFLQDARSYLKQRGVVI